MTRFKLFFGKEERIAKIIVTSILLAVFALIFGPGVYAQFSRQTGDTGWGYGYGYGYGYGHGYDNGNSTGYKTNFTYSASTTPGYGFGYGYLAASDSFDSANNQYVDPSVQEMIDEGVMVPNGTNAASTTAVTFNYQVYEDIGTATIVIPAGTTFTSASKTDFTALTASSSVTTTDLPTGYTSVGSIQFGLPSLGLTVSPAITINITVSTSYNGTNLFVYTKEPGGDWVHTYACTVSAGVCSFTTTNLSDFSAATGVASSNSGTNTGGGSMIIPATPAVPAVPKVNPATPATPASPAAAASRGIKFNKDLKYKSQNNDVTLLQKFLIAQNRGKVAKALAKNGVTKYFGKLSESALKEYQTAVGLPATGILDSATRAYINALNYIIDPAVKSGMLVRGSDGRIYIIKTVSKKLVKSYVSTLAELRKYKKAVVDVSDGLLAKYTTK